MERKSQNTGGGKGGKEVIKWRGKVRIQVGEGRKRSDNMEGKRQNAGGGKREEKK